MTRKPKWNIEKNVVYTYTNKHNGKKYCGITCRGLRVRSGPNGKNYTDSNPNSNFANAIRKYGWDAFESEILYSDLTREEACKKEQLVIRQLQLLDDRYGYNITSGGDKNINSKASVLLGDKNGMYGNGHLLKGGKNGRANKTKLVMQDGTTKYFDTQKECREYLNVGKDLFRSIRDSEKPFEFSIMTNTSVVENNIHVIGAVITVEP